MENVIKLEKSVASFDDLLDRLVSAKKSMALAKKELLDAETEILAHPDVDPKEEGVTNVGPFKITTGYTRSWDFAKLEQAQQEVPANLWPFKAKWMEERKGTKYLESNEPEIFERIRVALSLKPKKIGIGVI